MSEFTRHLPGTFSWPELSTTDQKGAVAFYRALLGWDVDDQPMGPDEIYSMFTMRALPVGAAYTMRPEEKQMGAPPHWNAYVTVEKVDQAVQGAPVAGAARPSVGMMQTPPHMPPGTPSFWLPYFLVGDVDASAALARSLGGNVHFGPQDIPNTGRFAVVADPQGPAFSVFTPAAR